VIVKSYGVPGSFLALGFGELKWRGLASHGEAVVCQNWFSIVGLVFDVAGFLMIAVEWHHMFKRDVYMREKRIDRDYAKLTAERRGEKFDDDADMEYTHAREFSRLLRKDTLYRAWLFYVGTTLIILGFFGQVFGSWPYGIFGFKSC
jgi:hypothetical protein